jgi:polyisoprenoid-binding protein YceI
MSRVDNTKMIYPDVSHSPGNVQRPATTPRRRGFVGRGRALPCRLSASNWGAICLCGWACSLGLTTSGLLVGVPVAAQAQPPAEGTADPRGNPAVSVTNRPASRPALPQIIKSGSVEIEHSRVYIRVTSTRPGQAHAISGQLRNGWLLLNPPEGIAAQGKLLIDIPSFDADSEQARRYIGLDGTTDADSRQQIRQTMLSPEVLDARKYPTAALDITTIVKLDQPSSRGLPQYELTGDFTLHGTTHTIRFPVDVEEVRGWYRIRGAFSVLQSQYGIKPYTKMFGALGVLDRLDIYGDLFVSP